MSTKNTTRQTVAALEAKLLGLGLKSVELKPNAVNQTKKFYDPKANVTYISFSNGHVARTLEGEGGKRVSLNRSQGGEKVMIKTELGRLNRILEYVTA